MEGAICTIERYQHPNDMTTDLLFAIDKSSDDILVSASAKGSRQIMPVERIRRQDHLLLYDAVALLTTIARTPDSAPAVFNAMDKVCQLLYKQYTASE